MERQIAEGKREHHHHQHPDDAAAGPQHVVRRVANLRQLGAVVALLVEAVLRAPRRHHHLVRLHRDLRFGEKEKIDFL